MLTIPGLMEAFDCDADTASRIVSVAQSCVYESAQAVRSGAVKIAAMLGANLSVDTAERMYVVQNMGACRHVIRVDVNAVDACTLLTMQEFFDDETDRASCSEGSRDVVRTATEEGRPDV